MSSLQEAFRRLAELAGDRWDGIDAQEFVNQIRGALPPLVNKPPFDRTCPDCHVVYSVDRTYSDEMYLAHKAGDPNAVCPKCFDAFDGLTIEQMVEPSPERRGEKP